MANDPLPLPDIPAEPPPDNVQSAHDTHGAHEERDAHGAEYEAIYAEITATERGRWFLSEHVKRNSAANTDRLVDSLARAEAAMRGDTGGESPGALADDLARLAAAIGQVEAVIAASAPSAAGGLAASERIQDVAFALRERVIDPALCDELENALFEIGDAFARHDAAAERAQGAVALLRGVEASINALIAFVAESAQAGPASSGAEPPVSAADARDESLAAEPLLFDSVSSEPAATEPVETPPAELELTARPGSVTPSMWETVAAPDAEAMANDLTAPPDSAFEDAEASEEPADDLRASEENVGENLSVEVVAEGALPPALSEAATVSEPLPEAGSVREEVPSSEATDDALPLALSEEVVASELLAGAGSLPDEVPSGAATIEQSPEESRIELSVPVQATAEKEVELALQLDADATDLAADTTANDENAGIVGPAEDAVEPCAADASEPTWSADDDIESLLEADPADPRPTATQPAGAQEDLDDLFEPLPPEPDVQPAAVNAVQSEPRQQMFSPELPPPVFSASELPPPAFAASAMQIGASPAEPPLVPVAPAPVARPIARPAPSDPLAAVRALSAEELIALFS